MPSCDPDDLMAAANEIYSKIPSGRQLAVQTYLMAVRAGITTDPDELAELAKHFNYGDQQSLQVQSYILCQIANGGSGTCANLEGAEDDPTGVYTPDFIGQTYEGPDSVWKATGLTDADWTEICNDAPSTELVIPSDTLEGFEFSGSDDYTDFSFPNLTEVIAFNASGSLTVSYNSTMSSISVPILESMDGTLNLSGNPLVSSYSFPSLTNIGGACDLSGCAILTSISCPLLVSIGNNLLFSGPMITSVDMPDLETVGGVLDFNGSTSLASLSLPSLTTIGQNVSATGCTSLTSFSCPLWLPTDITTIDFNNCALDEASVDLILERCVLAGVSTCTIDLSGGANAAPSVSGQADKAALILAGNTVTTN